MTVAPTFEPTLARAAALVADPTRARMLSYLLAGEYASAGELARAAGVAAATASGHLTKLLDANLITCEPRGRHRYYRLADGDVAHALEALAFVAERQTHQRTWSSPARVRLRRARSCYGHLAGELGVALLDRMLASGWLEAREHGFRLTADGAEALAALGIDGAAVFADRDAPARTAYRCLDWSERRDHLAGRLASTLLEQFIGHDWLRRRRGERSLELTPAGRRALQPLLGSAIDVG